MARSRKPTRTQAAANRKRRRRKPAPRISLLSIVDELNDIRGLLGTIPELQASARLIREERSEATSPRDHLARWARDALKIDLDTTDDETLSPLGPVPHLGDLATAPDAVLDVARWRLRRLGMLLLAVRRRERKEVADG